MHLNVVVSDQQLQPGSYGRPWLYFGGDRAVPGRLVAKPGNCVLIPRFDLREYHVSVFFPEPIAFGTNRRSHVFESMRPQIEM